jgi:TDG/mug DNA glycosylase family protein
VADVASTSRALAGFAPVAGPRCTLLILGSFPGVASLQRREYYGFRHNRFWPLMQRLFGVAATATYPRRLRALVAQRVALWDVLASCVRPGSRDDRIDPATIVTNDLAAFLASHPRIVTVACNGGTAARLFRRHAWPTIDDSIRVRLRVLALPSTSPLNARMTLRTLERRWRRGIMGTR